MSHSIIIGDEGVGPGGTATGSITWTPGHDLSPAEQIRRTKWAEKKLGEINDKLYAAPGYEHDDPFP